MLVEQVTNGSKFKGLNPGASCTSRKLCQVPKYSGGNDQGILEGGSITVPLTSCLTGLESAV
jgi:hypothetical protein